MGIPSFCKYSTGEPFLYTMVPFKSFKVSAVLGKLTGATREPALGTTGALTLGTFATASKTWSGRTDWGTSISVFFWAKWQLAQTRRPVASRGFLKPCWAKIGYAKAGVAVAAVAPIMAAATAPFLAPVTTSSIFTYILLSTVRVGFCFNMKKLATARGTANKPARTPVKEPWAGAAATNSGASATNCSSANSAMLTLSWAA
mmetsp:Transcript_51960/g.92734  ORF Transcript_51960/g.92734 Transcript_51960/m.92734 type:complete len:202 (-) Transcript_51960:816-1421(-)